MRVALINNFPPYSGTGKVAYELFNGLKEVGVGVDLFCTHFMRPEEKEWPENKEVKFLHKFAYKENETLSRLLIYFLDPYLIPRRYDLFHATNHMLGRFAKILHPSIVTVHDVLQFKYRENMGNTFVSRFYNHFMDESIKSLSLARHLIAVSSWSADDVSKILDVPREKISVVFNGIDHSVFKPRDKEESRKYFNLPQKEKIILHVGSEIPRKNLKTLYPAFKAVKEKYPDAYLLRLGEKTSSSENIIEKLGLAESIIYLKDLKDGEVPFVYSSADLVVLPSLEEGFGFPVIEAQACGVPVIASKRSSLPEIGGEACLYLSEAESVENLSALMAEALGSDLLNLIEAGLGNSRRFSWKKTAKETVNVYNKVLEII